MTDDLPLDHPGRRLACQDLVELLTDYLEGALPPEVAGHVDAHLAICPPCRVYLDQVQETVTRLGRLDGVDRLTDEVQDSILASFRDMRGRSG